MARTKMLPTEQHSLMESPLIVDNSWVIGIFLMASLISVCTLVYAVAHQLVYRKEIQSDEKQIRKISQKNGHNGNGHDRNGAVR